MFTSLKSFIDSRLGRGIVIDDFVNEYGFFIKINASYLYSTAFFLKNDPDLRLTLLDQIIVLPKGVLIFANQTPNQDQTQILYQLKSLKLPYRVTITIEANEAPIASLSPLFAGAKWLESDICAHNNINIDHSEREA